MWTLYPLNQMYSQSTPRILYSRTPLIRNNCDGEISGYPENSDNWIFL